MSCHLLHTLTPAPKSAPATIFVSIQAYVFFPWKTFVGQALAVRANNVRSQGPGSLAGLVGHWSCSGPLSWIRSSRAFGGHTSRLTFVASVVCVLVQFNSIICCAWRVIIVSSSRATFGNFVDRLPRVHHSSHEW